MNTCTPTMARVGARAATEWDAEAGWPPCQFDERAAHHVWRAMETQRLIEDTEARRAREERPGDFVGPVPKQPEPMCDLLNQMINDWPQVDTDDDMNGGDAVDALISYIHTAKALLQPDAWNSVERLVRAADAQAARARPAPRRPRYSSDVL